MDLWPQVLAYVPLFVLVLCRCSGIMLVAPVLGHTAWPARMRIAFVLLLTFVLLPLAPGPVHAPASMMSYAPLLFIELGIGLMIGFLAGMALAGVQAGGELIAEEIGLQMATLVSPEDNEEQTATATLFWIVATLIFLTLDGHHWLIRALALSMRIVPPGMGHWTPGVFDTFLAGFSGLFITAVQAAAPLLALMFLTTVVIALMAKAVPQMNLLLVGYPVKVFFGLAALAVTFPLIFPVTTRALNQLHGQLLHLLQQM